jgi:hypothetical protein
MAKKPEPKKKKLSNKEQFQKDLNSWVQGFKGGAVMAANLVPVGKAASVVGKFATATKATKLSSGASKVKTKKFTQGEKARITNTPPKKSKAGPNSPIRGTKVEVTYKTKELTPKQQASLTTGRIAREKTKKAGTYAKGALTGAYVMNEVDKAKAKKKSK